MPRIPLSDLENRVGEQNESVESLRVERGKVAEFARAIHDDHAVHRDAAVASARGHDRVPAPLTFLRTADFPHNRTEAVGTHKHYGHELAFDERFEVHGEEAFEFHRPVYVGDVLDGTTTLADVYQREGGSGLMTFVDLETEYFDADGDPVMTQRTTTLELTGLAEQAADADHDSGTNAEEENGSPDADTSPDAPSTADVGAGVRVQTESADADAPRVRSGEALTVGDEAPVRVLPDLVRGDFVRYAGASGDFNPIHYDGPYAKDAGNPSVFGQGMLLSGFASTTLTAWFGVATVRAYSTRFIDQIWPGDTITVTGVVDEFSHDDETSTVRVSLSVTDQNDDPVASASATVEIPRSPD
jgi:acyl dehydratase